MNQEEFNRLEKRVTALFEQSLSPDAIDAVGGHLAHTALRNTYIALLEFGKLGKFEPHPLLPEEFVPLLDRLNVESFSPEELVVNTIERTSAREELVRDLVKKARRDPQEFIDVIERLNIYVRNYHYDARSRVKSPDMPLEESQHSLSTATIAYFLLPDLWRDVSLKLVGKGNYLIGFSQNGQPLSKRIREPPDNRAAIFDATTKWHRLADHAISFFTIPSLDRLVQDNDSWSGIDVVDGYPIIADASTIAYQLLSFGYNNRERYSPILHNFPLSKEKIKYSAYKEGQSIASITVLDLNEPKKGLVYLIRHTDGTIAAGNVFLDSERSEFDIISSNTLQHARKSPFVEDMMDPITGVGVLVASFGRDMMVYNKRDEAYREERGMQSPSQHQNLEPVVIMLPRTRYVYNRDTSMYRSESRRLQMLVREVSPHYRSYHRRTLPEGQRPSEKQLELNASLPVPLKLEPGQTFVKDSWVGGYDPNMVNQYKSKSAAAVLFSAR